MAIDLWRTRPSMANPMNRAVDRLFQEAFASVYGGRDGGAESSGQTGVQSLPVTIWETGDAFHAALMAPGVDQNMLTVTVQEDTLSIEGEMNFEPPEGARMIWQEFGPTRFRRSLRFGTPIDPNRVEAIYRNGLLLLTLPKSEEARPRQVRVQVSEDGHAQPMHAEQPASETTQSQTTQQEQPAQESMQQEQPAQESMQQEQPAQPTS